MFLRVLILPMSSLFVLASSVAAQPWSEPVSVRSGEKQCVTYRARQLGEYLIVEAVHEGPWHTYAMDNEQRVARKLAGVEPLGVELPTTIDVGKGLEVVGPWYQSPPKDLSQPEIQWYTWGFEGRALFVAKVRSTGQPTTTIRLRGQVCDSAICQTVDVELPLTLSGGDSDERIDLDSLVMVEDDGGPADSRR